MLPFQPRPCPLQGLLWADPSPSTHRVWSAENSADDLTRTADGGTVDVHIDNPAEELNFRKN